MSEYESQNKNLKLNLMVKQGNDITFVSYPGMEHGFFHYGRHENKYFHETNFKLKDFFKSLGFI